MDSEGTGHTKALHISIECKGYHMFKMLIYSG